MHEYQIKPEIWFSNREVIFKPKHFLKATTPLNESSNRWLCVNITGRYSITTSYNGYELSESVTEVSFENVEDLVLYELRWS